jgi:S1-C subfamily serine protease
MSFSIDYYTQAVGKIIVRTKITFARRSVSSTRNISTNGSGFVVDGHLDNGKLSNSPSPNTPIVVTVAHMVPSRSEIIKTLQSGSTLNSVQTEYWFKRFDPYSPAKIYKFYKLNLVSYNRGVDLAILEFSPETPYDGLTMIQWNINPIKSGQECYVIGYPLGDSQFSITHGSVRDPTYCFSNFMFGIDQIYHSAPATEGNSGCCILDINGKIIGIHSWGTVQSVRDGNRNFTSNFVLYEDFTGGASTKAAYPILSSMLNNKSRITTTKYYPRCFLGITVTIMDDEFRINNYTNPVIYQNIKDIDGIKIDTIVPGSTVENYNKTASTKLEVNDIITHIMNKDGNFVEVGYMRGEAPVNVLFLLPLGSAVQLKIIKASNDYGFPTTITISNVQGVPEALDVQFSRNI